MIQATTPQAPTPAPQSPVPQINVSELTSPRDAYIAARAQVRELRNQLDVLRNERLPIASRLRQGNAAPGADLQGLEGRLTALDARIADMQKQLAAAEDNLTRITGVPGAVPPLPPPSGIPEEVAVMSVVFMLVVLLPLMIAFSRRIWRRGAGVALPKDLTERLNRIEEGVDTMALEVERIGEGQRFVTNLLIEAGPPRALGVGAMEPLELQDRERVERRTPR